MHALEILLATSVLLAHKFMVPVFIGLGTMSLFSSGQVILHYPLKGGDESCNSYGVTTVALLDVDKQANIDGPLINLLTLMKYTLVVASV